MEPLNLRENGTLSPLVRWDGPLTLAQSPDHFPTVTNSLTCYELSGCTNTENRSQQIQW